MPKTKLCFVVLAAFLLILSGCRSKKEETAAPAPQKEVDVTVKSAGILTRVSENSYNYPDSRSWEAKKGYKFLRVDTELKFHKCNDDVEDFMAGMAANTDKDKNKKGTAPKPEPPKAKGILLKLSQASLLMPDKSRLSPDGGGDSNNICVGCDITSTQLCKPPDAGATKQFSFIFILPESVDPKTAIFDFKGNQVPLSSVAAPK